MIRGRGVALSVRLSAHAEGRRVEPLGRVYRDPVETRRVEFIETRRVEFIETRRVEFIETRRVERVETLV